MMSKQYMDAMDSSHESDHDLIPSDILEKNIDRIQTHRNVNIREACYKFCDHISQRKS